jgi:predicted DNA-binding transcriptional regulator AlpA
MQDSDPEFLTIKAACQLVGGNKPISLPTFYRAVKAGRLPAPEHPTPGISRVRRSKLLEMLNRTHGGA